MSAAPQKSIWVTFLYWLVGGLFGLHHAYLRRDRQAFIYVTTLGGCGMSWISDLFSIPEMVREANADPRYVEKMLYLRRLNEKPAFSVGAFFNSLMVSYFWAQLFMVAIPDVEVWTVNLSCLHWLVPLVVALGIWTSGNCGSQQGNLWPCLAAAYATYPIRYVLYDEEYWLFGMTIVSTLVFDHYSKQWRRLTVGPPRRASTRRRLLVVGACLCVFLAMSVNFYYNGKITDGEGDEIPVHELVSNAMEPQWWSDVGVMLGETWKEIKQNGFADTWKQIVDQLEGASEINSYKVLGLLPTASQSEITSTFRKLSKEYHPDKIKGTPAENRAAQVRFMEISQAYEKLSKQKSKRRHKNRKSAATEESARDSIEL